METFAERGIQVVPIPADEYQTMGCNILAVEPRRVVMLDGNPRTRAALEAAGREVHGYDGSEISVKGRRRPHLPDGADLARRQKLATPASFIHRQERRSSARTWGRG